MSERSTAQKQAILRVLEEARSPLEVREILRLARKEVATLSQATVYRVIKSLLGKGRIVRVPLPDHAPVYEVAGKSHHHFFQCRRCERLYEVAGCDRLLGRLVPKGFRLEDHEVFLTGLCAACS